MKKFQVKKIMRGIITCELPPILQKKINSFLLPGLGIIVLTVFYAIYCLIYGGRLLNAGFPFFIGLIMVTAGIVMKLSIMKQNIVVYRGHYASHIRFLPWQKSTGNGFAVECTSKSIYGINGENEYQLVSEEETSDTIFFMVGTKQKIPGENQEVEIYIAENQPFTISSEGIKHFTKVLGYRLPG